MTSLGTPTLTAQAPPVDLDALREVLRQHNAIGDGPVPIEPLEPIEPLDASQKNTIIRFGHVVVKVSPPGLPIDNDAVQSAMLRVRDLAPTVLFTDRIGSAAVIATAFVPGRNWARLLASGNIDFRTFHKAGRFLDQLHGRANTEPVQADRAPRIRILPNSSELTAEPARVRAALHLARERDATDTELLRLHGAFVPSNIVLTTRGSMVATGWSAPITGPAVADLTTFLGQALSEMLSAPHTEDWYVDAGRSFLDGYGGVDIEWLRTLIGFRLIEQFHGSAQSDIVEVGRALVLGEQQLPWEA